MDSVIQPSVVSLWNEVALNAIRLGDPKPTEITRALHISHAAMYDAWAAYDEDAVGAYFTDTAQGEDSNAARETAVSFAAFHALAEVFPEHEYLFRALMTQLGHDPDLDTTDTATPEGTGIAAARAVLNIRDTDGSNAENEFADTTDYEPVNSTDPADAVVDPNAWTPLRVPNGTVRDENGIPIATDNPASYDLQKPLAPHWGEVTPFAIADSDNYLPPAPPKLGDFSEYVDANGKVTTGDAAFREQFGALVDISANLTPEQKAIAEYWADGPQTSTPPGHWNEIAQDIAARDGHSLEDDVKMFFALNNALFDTSIAVWDAKYTYDFARPQSAIRHLYEGQLIESWAGPNQGTQTIDGEAWQPYQNVTFVTPPFPEYTSGHSGFSYAAAAVLESFTGTDTLYDGTSRGAYDLDGDGQGDLLGYYQTSELAFEDYTGDPITLTWDTVWDAAAEAGLSRLYGGIHIQDGDLFGRQIGEDVGRDVWAATMLLFDRDGDNVFHANEAISGQITLGLGADEIIGALDEIDGLYIQDFGSDDRLTIMGGDIRDGRMSVTSGSAIVEIDADGDGTIDATVTFEGNFANKQFVAVTENNQTEVRVGIASDVQLTDIDERFITDDSAANVVAAGAGNDVLIGANGQDILDGDAGDDILLGNNDADILIGGAGSDTMTGGAGSDIFAFQASDEAGNPGFSADFIMDFELGVDKVELAGFTNLTFETLDWQTFDNGLGIVLPGPRIIFFDGIFDQSVFTASDFLFPEGGRNVTFAEPLPQILTGGNDRYISSNLFDDDVKGLAGNDAIVTGAGNDRVSGGLGDDVISAGSGVDLLEGGSGLDTLIGGAGSDIFRFFSADDPENTGFVLDTIVDFEIGVDKVELYGFEGISSFSDISFIASDVGLAADLGGGRLVAFEGIFDKADFDVEDFRFDGDDPTLALALRSDTGANAADRITSDAAIVGRVRDDVGVAKLEVRAASDADFVDATAYLEKDGSFKLDALALEELFGEAVEDGAKSYVFRVTDREDNSVEGTINLTLDRAAPGIAAAPTGAFDVSPDTLTVQFSEEMGDSAFDAASYGLTTSEGESVEITSIDQVSDDTALLNLADTLGDGEYALSVPVVGDVAGNTADAPETFDFSVDALTRIVSTGPTAGTQRANLDRQIVVEFDRPVDPTTVTEQSFQVLALGEPLAGRISVSSDGQVLTFFPDDLLPASTELRIQIDGETITGLDGKKVDANGDGTPGGTLSADFQTTALTRVADTNIEGFIFDANYRDENGLDIPLEGVVVKVVGLPGVQAVTDANGRFFLEDMPIPQVYLDFDASGVTNRAEFDYGTIVKPVDTVAGQTVGLTSGDKGFNIYFAALAEGDVTEIVEGQQTEAGIGTNGLANLTEIFPNVDPSEWEKLKVTIPADSLTFDDGSQATEVSVMVFEPDRIPAPLPEGFDPTVVFTVKAGDATNVDGKAQIDFPNLDNLAIGEKRPILSFDHDAGQWVQSGTAIVVDDGNGGTVLRSEGDTGVNTLGWKGIGGNPSNPVCDKPDDSDPLPDRDGDGIPDDIDPDANGDGIPDEEQEGDVEITAGLELFGSLPQISARLRFGIDLPTFLFDLDEIVGGGSSPEEALNILFDESIAFPDPAIELSRDFTFSTVVSSFTARFIPEINVNLANASVTGTVSAGVNVSGEVEFERGDNEIDINDVVVNPGGVNASVTVEYDAGFLSGLPIVGGLFSGDASISTTLAGLPTIDVNDIVGDIEIPLPFAPITSAVDDFFAGFEVSGSISTSFGANAFIRKSVITAGATELASSDPTGFESAFASTVQGDMTFAQVQQSVVLAALTTDNINVSTSMSVADDDRYYYVIETASEAIFRGSVARGQTIDELLPADEEYTVYVYAPLTNRWGIYASEDGRVPFDLKLNNIGGFDQDGDLIPYIGEYVIGTSDLLADTDGDGISDSAELDQGLNPLDGVGFPTGIIGTLALSGNARDVEVTGALDGSGGQTAYVATGDHGLAIVDASDFATPILQSQLDLTGDNSRVVVDATRDLAFVASTSGLHIVDVADPLLPQLVRTATIPGGAQSVMLRDGLLFVGGRDLYVVNPVAGAILTEIDTTGPVTDIAASGDTIFAVVDNRQLVSYAFNGQFLIELDSVTIPTPPVRRQPFEDFRIFVSDGVAYVSNGFDLTVIAPTRPLERGGYVTFDVSDPSDLALISNIDTPAVQAANLQTVTNGAGLGLVAAGQRGLQIHDTSDPDTTYDLIAEFDTPGDAQAVSLASGIAYIADGAGGLQVINFLPFDADGQAPTVTFNSSASDADATTPGVQVEEGETIRLDLGITDDVQIRNVELLLNGQVVLNDVSAPYELAFAVPALSSGATSVEVAVRATDTGGNSTTSESVVFEIIPDNTPPEVLSVTPTDDRLILVGESTVTLAFSEPVDDTTLSVSSVTIEAMDGTIVPALDLVLLADDQVALFTFPTLVVGDYTLNFDLTGVADRAGNAVVSPPASQTISVVDATAVWNDPAGGSWFDATKWRDGTIPTDEDGVAVVVDEGAVVTLSGTADVERLLLQGELRFSGGTLSTDDFEGNSGTLHQTGGTIEDTTINGTEDFDVRITGGSWNGVALMADGFVESGRILSVFEGLTVAGGLDVLGSGRVQFYGSQDVDGSGVVTLSQAGSSWLYLVSQDNSATEVLTLGADLALEGQGYITVSSGADHFRILGDVTAIGGELQLNYVDNDGAALSLDSAGGGFVRLQTAIRDSAITVAAGADVRAISSQLTQVSLGGAGTTRIQSATASDLAVLGRAEVEALTSAFATATLTVTDGLSVDGLLELSGTNTRTANLAITGAQEITGTGEITMTRNNAIGEESVRNQITLNSQLSTEREDLVFGADLTLSGTGVVTVSRGEDRIQVLGDVVGEEGPLTLRYIDNQGEALNIDSSNGEVRFGSIVENATITGTPGASGFVGFENGTQISNTTFDTAARIAGGVNAGQTVTFEDAITLNDRFELATQANREAYLYVDGTQSLGGTGEIVLSRANLNPGQTGSNYVIFRGDLSGTSEVLTFGAGLEISGDGLVYASSTEDSLKVLGQVRGTADEVLTLRDIDNDGAALNIDASAGTVRLGDRITEAEILGAGTVRFETNTLLNDITLGMDAQVGALTAGETLAATGGLTIDGTLELASGQSQNAYLRMRGEQVLDGSGDIVMSNANAPIGSFDNRLLFDSTLSASETLTLADTLTLRGQGIVGATGSGDQILLEGTLVADDGLLRVLDLAALEGTLGATADGELDVETALTLTERGTLAVGLAGSGATLLAGRIDVETGPLELMGTLALDLAPDFDADLADTFEILTSSSPITGSFDAFQGFDIGNGKAFKLTQQTNTLTLEVTTTTDAANLGFLGTFPAADPKPPFMRSDVALDDVSGRVADANVIADRTAPGAQITAFENVVLQADVTDESLLTNRSLTIEQGLTLDGVDLTVGGSSLAAYTLDVNGAQTLGGTGTLTFSTLDTGLGNGPRNLLRFDSAVSGAREILTIEDDITLRGDVRVFAGSPTEDRIAFLGTLEGVANGVLSLGGVDNGGAQFDVDASAGTVGLTSNISHAHVEAVAGQTGQLRLYTGANLQDVTLSIDSILDASGAGAVTVDVVDGLALDAMTLTLAGWNNRALLDFRGAQEVTGTGSIMLAANPAGTTDNDLRFVGFENFAETLSFGTGITIQGTGVIDALDAGDRISILGTLVGEAGGLFVNDLDNGGGTVTVDASAGTVAFGSGIANAIIAEAAGNTGTVDLLSNGGLRNVTLGIDTRLDAELSAITYTARDGLVLEDATLTVAGSEFATATLRFFGAQSLSGTGRVHLSDENALDTRAVNNALTFTGTQGGVETFHIAEGIVIDGYGQITVSSGDLLDFDGDAVARGGTLALQGITEITGDLTAEAGAVLGMDRTFGLSAGAGLTIGLAGAGHDLETGFVSVAGLVQRGGALRFDIAADFDAEIGTEFEILRTTQGFTDSFASVENTVIDATRALALVQDETSLFARVVDLAEAGQQLTRADLPPDPLVPVLSQNLTAQTIDQTFLDTLTPSVPQAQGDLLIRGGSWNGVALMADGFVESGRILSVFEGLTVAGGLDVLGSGRVQFYGSQDVDGSGVVTLSQAGSSWLYLVSQDNSATEVLTLGADLALEGQGYITVSSGADHFRILGDVTAIGGELQLNYVDNDGAALSLDSAGGGFVRLQTAIRDSAITVAAGADVRAISSQLTQVSLGGAGTTRIQSATASDLAVLGRAEVEALTSAFATATLTVTDGLSVDGLLELSGTNTRTANLAITGAQEITGTGEITMTRNNAIGEESVRNQITLNSQLSTEREDLVFGADLTLSGTGVVTVSRGEDRIQVLGDVVGEEGPLTLRYIDNQGEALNIDSSNGEVRFGSIVENATITGTPGASGFVGFENGTQISNTTFDTAARIAGGVNAGQTVTFEDAITLNDRFELATQANREAYLYVDGTQSLGGTGEIVLSRANLNPGQTGSNYVIFRGDLSGTSEVLTFGAGLEISGDGLVYASSTEDSLKVLGQVRGTADEVLTLRDIDNDGAALNIDASAGTVRLGDRITEAEILGAGTVRFETNTLLNDITLGMDAQVGALTAGETLAATGGLTIDGTLELASGQSQNAYLRMRGEQVLDGSGDIVMSNANAPIGSFDNRLLFDSTLSASETLTLADTLTLRGQGIVGATGSGDQILLEGTLVADDGLLRVLDLAALEGTLGATADGELDVETALTLTERGTLAVGLAGSGATLLAGRIDVETGPLELMGTLALDLAPDFDADLADTFEILTSSSPITGSFDAFQGFDIGNGKAFKLTQQTNTLTLEVTTTTDAANLGFLGTFPAADPKPPFMRSDVALDDVSGRVADANVIADRTAPGAQITAFENVVLQADVTDESLLTNRSLTIEQGLTLDGVDLTVGGSSLAAYTLDVNGAQTLGGTGTLTFSTLDTGLGNGPRNLLRFDSAVSGAREILTIEDDITLRGDVRVFAGSPTEDRIAFLGTLEGVANGVLSLGGVDNGGAQFDVDASAGTVGLTSNISHAHVEAVAGQTGQLRLYTGANLQDVTLSIDSILDASGAGAVTVDVVDGLALDAMTLTLAGWNNRALLDFRGAQEVTGTGSIMLAANPAGTTDNDLRFVGFENFAETLSFGTGITIQGTGVIDALDAGDRISILGTLVGEAGGLFVNDLDNGGGTVTVDASAGTVAFGSGIANAIIAEAAGNTGTVDLLSNGGLRNVTLGIDTRLDAELSAITYTARDGLVLEDATLTVAGSEFATATLRFFGAQSLSGTGRVHLSDENALDTRAVNNALTFTGTQGGVETFHIAEGIVIDGYGQITVSSGDLLDFDGDAVARGGTLALQGITEITGDLTAEAGAVLGMDRTFGLSAGAGLTIGLAGAGHDLETGFVSVAGLVQRGGALRFDIAADFDAEIGTEFEILRTTQGFTDSFASVENTVIDATRALALVQDETSLFARVVDLAEAGQQLTRADLPPDPLVPVLSQNLTAQTIDQTFLDTLTPSVPQAQGDLLIRGGSWNGVALMADGFVESGRILSVFEGLTVAGGLDVLGSGRVQFYGSQDVDGSGVVTLSQAGSSWLYLVSQDNSATEVLTLGADLALEGQGYITVSSGADHFRILGDVTAIGGELQLNYVDNDGAALSLDSAGGGFVRLQTAIRDSAITVAAGADVRAISSQLTQVSLGGAGTTRIQSATASDLAVLGRAEVEALTSAFATATLTVTDGLSVDGLLELSGTNTRTANLAITGAQEITGTGEITMTRNNAIGEESVRNQITLNSQLSTEREDLVFGADLTLSGTGVVTVSRGEDRIQVLGDVVGEEGPLTLRYIDNQGEALNIDSSNGEVRFGSIVENATITGTPGASGFVGFENGTQISNTTFDTAARIAGGVNAGQTVTFEDAITLNDRFELATQANREAYLYVDGTQSLGGTGEIVLSRANLNPGQTGSNYVIFRGDLSGTSEVLTFGAGLEISGDGLVYASSTEDSLKVLGQVRGTADEVLTLRDIDNDGAALNIDASAGTVRLGDRITEAEILGAGTVRFETNTLLNDITLGMDAQVGALTAGETLAATGGLTIDGTLELASGQSQNAYLRMRGEQVLDGSGDIVMSNANAPIGSFDNRLLFDSTLSASETLTLADTLTLRGQGIVGATGSGDQILLEGTLVADDGLLRVLDLAALEGTLGATADGELDVETALTLTERGTLAVGLAGSGATLLAGRIDVETGPLELMGTLALDLAPDFDADLADTFEILTSSSPITGSFDAFQGFDIGNGKAFKLTQQTNTLTLEVTTTTDAANLGFGMTDDFAFDFV